MSAMVPATTMHVAKMRKVVTIDFIALSGSVAHPAKRYPVETFFEQHTFRAAAPDISIVERDRKALQRETDCDAVSQAAGAPLTFAGILLVVAGSSCAVSSFSNSA